MCHTVCVPVMSSASAQKRRLRIQARLPGPPEAFFRQRSRLQLARTHGDKPHDDPSEAHGTDDDKGPAPRADVVGHEGLHNLRRDDGSDAGAALQDAVSHGAIFFIEKCKGGLQGAGPVTRLEKAEAQAAHEQLGVAARPPGDHAHHGPACEHDGVEPVDLQTIRQEAEEE